MRFAFDDASIPFTDEIAGPVTVKPRDLGDIVLWRKDGLPSYQLVVPFDDAAMGVTQVLRGKDLLLSTARQLALYKAAALPAPKQWAHVPLMLAQDKRRLAKRDGDLSLKALRERGVKPEKIIGLCAQSARLMTRADGVCPRELFIAFNLKAIAREDSCFPEPLS